MDLGAVREDVQCWGFSKVGHRGAEFEGKILQTHIIVSGGHGKGGDWWNTSLIYPASCFCPLMC